jgi:glyoxylase I family protein
VRIYLSKVQGENMASAKSGPGFHHIATRAYDFDKTVAFYQESLGLTRRYGWGEPGKRAAMMDVGDGNYIEVFEGRSEAAGEGGILHFALRVADTDEAYRRAIAGGATSQMEPKDVDIAGDYPVRVRIAFVKGFDHEVIEFFQNEEL